MASTSMPEMWWLNSDHARSASLRGALGSSIGISASEGECRLGSRGVKRVATSASVARSDVRSTAGGSEVSDAAANSTVSPRPTSTSTKRRRMPWSAAADVPSIRRIARELNAPSVRRPPRITILVSTMSP